MASWIITIILGGVGAYWLYVELSLTDKTFFLPLAIILIAIFVIKVIVAIVGRVRR